MPPLLLALLIIAVVLLYAEIWLVGVWGYKKFGVLLSVGGLATAVFYLGDLSSPVDLGLTILSCVVLLLIAPLYAIVGFCILLASISGQDLTIQNCATFLIVGYVWCFTKLCGYALNDSAKNEKRARETEKIAREAESRRVQEDEEQKVQQAKNRKQAKFRKGNKEIFACISELISFSQTPFDEMRRVVNAAGGGDYELDSQDVVRADIARILVAFRDTEAAEDTYLETLWEEIVEHISPSDIVNSLFEIENMGIEIPLMLPVLNNYDKLQNTTFASKAASTYLSIVSSVFNRCEGSLAAKVVAGTYTELLRPYIHESGGGGYAGNSNASGSKSARKSVCEKCVKGYQLLDLPFGASKDEVKQKRDALANVFHADHTGGMSKRTRDIAEEQLKRINVAYPHILKCRFSGIKGSEPPPAPHQSTSETTAGEKIKHQPSPASPSGESEVEKAEHRPEVHSLQDVKDEIDALRKKVYATNKAAGDLLEKLKKWKHTSEYGNYN